MEYPTIIHDSAIEKFELGIADEQKRLSEYFLDSLQKRMAELNMNQSDLAFTLGKTRAYVSKLFTRGANLTIKSMVELAHSLDMRLTIQTKAMPNDTGVAWVFEKNEPNSQPLKAPEGQTASGGLKVTVMH